MILNYFTGKTITKRDSVGKSDAVQSDFMHSDREQMTTCSYLFHLISKSLI